jgi:hypothetical protein
MFSLGELLSSPRRNLKREVAGIEKVPEDIREVSVGCVL